MSSPHARVLYVLLEHAVAVADAVAPAWERPWGSSWEQKSRKKPDKQCNDNN